MSVPSGFAGIDPITVEVIRGYLDSILQSMSSRIIRSALSPNITERQDVSTAIMNPEGRTVVQYEVAPIHLAELIGAGQSLLENYAREDIADGDVFIVNDCYTGGGTHLPDVTIITPVFEGRELIGIVANLAHHVDVGGRPGSAPGGAATIYEEGIRIPVTRLVEAGELRVDVLRLILLNCRMADQRRGDLLAQIAANDLAASELRVLCARYGVETVIGTYAALQEYAIRKLQAKIAEIPDGLYEFEDFMDDDGANATMIPVRVALNIRGTELHADFTGTGPQTEGNINLVWAGTAGCVLYALRAALDPTIPPTSALLDVIQMTVPEGSLVNPLPPAGCDARVDTCQRVVGVLLGAFAKALPGRLPAGSCDALLACLLSGVSPRDNAYYTLAEAFCGGSGGRPDKDGLDAVQVHMANVANFPIEVAEAEYPVRYRRHTLRRDSGGAGEWRGGLGEIREIEILAPKTLLGLHGDRQKTAPWGTAGGRDGAPGEVWVNAGLPQEKRMPSKIGRYPLQEGDVISLFTPGAGGYGHPSARDPEAVLEDVRDERVSVDAARADYFVAIRHTDDGYVTDEAETARLRAEIAPTLGTPAYDLQPSDQT